MADHNIIRHTQHLPQKAYKAFPSMRWDPKTGEAQVFHSEDEVPAGFLEHHPDHVFDGEKPEKSHKPAPAKALDREEAKKLLSDAGIAFQPNAGTAKLNELLLTSVKEALSEAKIEFDIDSTDAKALIALFPTKE